MSDDLVKRYEAVFSVTLLIKPTPSWNQEKATLLEQKTQLLAKLKSEFNIDSLEQLKSKKYLILRQILIQRLLQWNQILPQFLHN